VNSPSHQLAKSTTARFCTGDYSSRDARRASGFMGNRSPEIPAQLSPAGALQF
jgi:hypothetical protein